jgi:SAM-dependent methyltransferase
VSQFADYALYYDRLYRDKDYAAEAAYVLGLIRRNCPQAQSFLELGCGTGAHAQPLCAAGVRVHGVDRSAEMLELARARRQNLPSEIAARMLFTAGDVRQVRLSEAFDVVISLFHVVSYQSSNQDLRDCFATARHHLRRGGVFVFDCWYGPAVLSDRPTVRIKRWEDDQTGVTRIAEPTLLERENVVDVHYTILVRNRLSETTKVLQELHRMRYLFQPEIDSFASLAGLERIEARAWMSESEPDLDSWNACFVLRG